MKELTLRAIQYDLYDSNGELVVSAYRLRDGRWNFHSMEGGGWWKESTRRLPLNRLAKTYFELKKQRADEKKAKENQ